MSWFLGMAAQRVETGQFAKVQAFNCACVCVSVWVAHLVLSPSLVILVQNSIITDRHYNTMGGQMGQSPYPPPPPPLPVLEGRREDFL